jgi:flagellar protein FlaG
MTDQVSPLGSGASGLPMTLSATAAPVAAGSGSGSSSSARVADPSAQDRSGEVATGSTGSTGTAVEQVNAHLQQTSSQLRVQVDMDSDTGKTIYKVVDPTTGQVVLQVPSQQVLAMAHTLQSLDKKTDAPGVLIDQKG